MRLRRDGLSFNPPPPHATGTRATSLTLHSFHYLGSRLRQRVNQSHVEFELLEKAAGAVSLGVACEKPQNRRSASLGSAGGTTPLVVGSPVSFPRSKCSLGKL